MGTQFQAIYILIPRAGVREDQLANIYIHQGNKTTVIDTSTTAITEKFELTCSKEFMDRFKKFLSMIQYNGGVGHSAICALFVDGDGSDHPKFNLELPKVEIKEKGTYPDKYEVAG